MFFVTGLERLPIEGFCGLRTIRNEPAPFTIEPIRLEVSAYPRAHTCFNRLDLPKYKKYRHVMRGIKFALENYKSGYGLEWNY